MSNESISRQTLARIKAEYLARYEIEMDDWSAIILLDNQTQFQNMDSQLRAVLDENKNLSGKIKDSVKTVQFNSILEAFMHGLGKGLPYSITALVLGILYYVYMSTYVVNYSRFTGQRTDGIKFNYDAFALVSKNSSSGMYPVPVCLRRRL